MRTDSLGNVKWQNNYGSDSIESALALRATPDGGFVFGGSVTSPDFSTTKMEVAKIDSVGNLKWAANFGGSNENNIRGLTVLPSGDVIAVGDANLPTTSTQFGYHLRLKANGTPDDGRFFAKGNFRNFFGGVDITPDGGIAMGGSSWSYISANSSFYDPWLVKLKANGDTAFAKRYTMVSTQFCYGIKALKDGDILMFGQVAISDTFQGTFIMKVDSVGKFKWFKAFDFKPTATSNLFERIYDVAPARDNSGYIAVGYYKDGAMDSIKIKGASGQDSIIIGERSKAFIFL